jgi:hypothetical protein
MRSGNKLPKPQIPPEAPSFKASTSKRSVPINTLTLSFRNSVAKAISPEESLTPQTGVLEATTLGTRTAVAGMLYARTG